MNLGKAGILCLLSIFCFILKLSYFRRRTQELEARGKYSLQHRIVPCGAHSECFGLTGRFGRWF